MAFSEIPPDAMLIADLATPATAESPP